MLENLYSAVDKNLKAIEDLKKSVDFNSDSLESFKKREHLFFDNLIKDLSARNKVFAGQIRDQTINALQTSLKLVHEDLDKKIKELDMKLENLNKHVSEGNILESSDNNADYFKNLSKKRSADNDPAPNKKARRK